MKTHQNLSKIAFNQYHTKKQPLYYQVFAMGKVVFEGDIRLCQHFIKQHRLKTKPKGKY